MAKKGVRRKQVIPKDESKAARFVRVVEPRVSKAMKAISTIGFCAGSTYEYTPKQVEQITAGLFRAVNSLVDTFAAKKVKTGSFSFKE